jgi:hypothetical protein
MDRNPKPGGSYVTVRFGAQVWELKLGSSVTFGRSDDCDIVLTRPVEDRLVSRQAGRLTAVDGGVLVTNESRRNPVYLRGIPGAEHKIEPRMTLGTMPFERCRVVVIGGQPEPYVLDITCLAAEGSSAAKPVPADTAKAGDPTTLGYQRIDMPRAQRRYLAALCEPLLTGVGAAPASYREIAERCGVALGTVRKSLDALRMKVSEYGVPGLIHPGDASGKARGTVNLRARLADWAVSSGNATHGDLEGLD